MTVETAFEILKRDAISIYSEDSLWQKLNAGKTLTIKLGADPSRPDLHLGHSVVLRKLKLLQNMGHEIVFVIGDFTGMIGDPSGKSKTRVPLTFEQTRTNGQSYFNQVTKILDKDKTKIVYNSEWLAKMNFADVLQLAGKYTLARIMERDDFAKRYAENKPIGMHEIFYPLMQGYDSVALKADIEVGGTDQTFNLLVGRELQRDYNQPSQVVITFPLLIGLDGTEKMSKSLDNYIGIDEEPDIMYEKAMTIPDPLLVDYFRLTTNISEDDYMPLIQTDIREAHFYYSQVIVTMYHGEVAADQAKKRYLAVAAGGVPTNMETLALTKEPISVIAILRLVDFASSNGDARRLIQGKAIKIDHQVVVDPNMMIDSYEDLVISRGKNRFFRVCFGDK